MHAVAKTLNVIADELRATYLEREKLIEASLLALLSRNHLFALGPPGSGKTLMQEDLMRRLVGAKTFEVLLSGTLPESKVLGPIDVPELRATGNEIRKTKGFLPTADVAVLDEIGKISPVLGHNLLAALNERKFHEVDANGEASARRIPISTVFTAANELIAANSDDAAALWDRLAIRVVVDYIKSPANFETMFLSEIDLDSGTTIEWSELKDVIDNEIPSVKFSVDAVQAVQRLRDKLIAESIQPSDRRFKAGRRVMQAAAFLAGRDEVIDDDVHVMQYLLWDTPEQIRMVERLCLSVSNPDAERLLALQDLCSEINLGLDARKGQATSSLAPYGTEQNGKIKLSVAELEELMAKATAAGRNTSRIQAVLDEFTAVRRRIYVEALGIPASKAANL